jgi:SET domain-containing protein
MKGPMPASEEVPLRSRSRRSNTRTSREASEPAVVVRRSAIQGRGVFATRDIAKDALIVEYLGQRITHETAADRYDDESVRRHHTFLFTVDDALCIDGGRHGNEARLINHSCEPNAYATVEDRRIFIRAARHISAGEEIVYDYWYSTDPGYTLADLRRLYPCRCGAAKCRGTLAAPPKKPRTAAASKARKAKRNGSR